MNFENKETENAYMDLYEKFGYFHINYGHNHVITIEDVKTTDKLRDKFKEKY